MLIGGPCLSDGYFAQAALTAERFLPDPYGNRPGAVLYDTGDRARFFADGNIEFLGRRDHQVKIRGFRIELGEIEAVLKENHRVLNAVVLAHGKRESKRLVAYIQRREDGTGEKTEDDSLFADLRHHLSQFLPEYMVPGHFLTVTSWPMTPNGKLDRKALPAPMRSSSAENVAPRNALELAIAEAWKQALSLDNLGIHDNFFEMGGDSILSIRIIAKIRRQGLRLTLAQFYDHPTIAGLARAAEQSEETDLTRESTGPESAALHQDAGVILDRYPLSPMQQGMLYYSLFAADTANYFQQLTCQFSGNFRLGLFRKAWQEILVAHPVLRSAFVWQNSETMYQEVWRQVELPWEILDWTASPESEQELKFNEWLRHDQGRGFDLLQPPLMRSTLFKIGQDRYRWVWSHHHLIMDGWSMAIILRELATRYRALTQSLESKPDHSEHSHKAWLGHYPDGEAPSYRRFIDWLSARDAKTDETYWRAQLRGFCSPTRLNLELPAIQKDGEWPVFAESELEISAREMQTVLQFVKAHRLTLNALCQGALVLLLNRYGNGGDVVFGATHSGRPSDLAGVDLMVGPFINTVPVRAEIDLLSQSIVWLKEIMDRQRARESHVYPSLVQIQKWSPLAGGTGLFEILFVLENYPKLWDLPWDGVSVEGGRLFERSNYPFTLIAVPGQTLQLKAYYRRSRFTSRAVARVLEHFRNLLLGLAGLKQKPLGQINMMAEEERQDLLQSVLALSDSPAEGRGKTPHQVVSWQMPSFGEAVFSKMDSTDHSALGRQPEALLADDQMRLCPLGVPGQLYLRTSKSFEAVDLASRALGKTWVPDPFSTKPSRFLYATGRLMRRLGDGRLEDLGSLDQVMCKNGTAINPEEIVNALAGHPVPLHAFVSLIPVKGKQPVLMAHCRALKKGFGTKDDVMAVSDGCQGAMHKTSERKSPDTENYLAFLRARLPEYLVPRYLVILDQWPLTPEGQIDVKALPLPEGLQGQASPVEPRDDLERSLVAIWSEVLDLPQVGVHDNFFDLGGDSISSIRILSAAKQAGLELNPQHLFEHQTVAELARVAQKRALQPPLESQTPAPDDTPWKEFRIPLTSNRNVLEIEDEFPLTPVQAGMLFHGVQGLYCQQIWFDLKGGLDEEKFQSAWHRATLRHGALRTSFVWESLREPLQRVHTQVDLFWQKNDWKSLSAQVRKTRLEAFLRSERVAGFSLDKPGLMRFGLFRNPKTWTFVCTFHHIILDGWSLPILFRDVFAAYHHPDTAPTADPPPSFKNYVAWLQTHRPKGTKDFWCEELADLPAPPVLFSDRKTPMGHSGSTSDASHHLSLRSETAQALRKLAVGHRVTLQTLIQGAWALALGHFSSAEDVIFGSVHSGRHPQLTGVDTMVGLLIQTLPCRVRMNPEQTLGAWMKALQKNHLERDRYGHIPLRQLHQWVGSSLSDYLFDTLFIYENFPMVHWNTEEPDSLVVGSVHGYERTHYPLALTVLPEITAFSMIFRYHVNRFDKADIAQLGRHLQYLLEGMADWLNLSLANVPLLSESARRHLLYDWNRTQRTQATAFSLDLVEPQFIGTPERVAIVFDDHRGTVCHLTFGHLDDRSAKLASRLGAVGIGSEDLVAFFLEQTPSLVIALVGVMRAGAAYLPLDPSFPVQRIAGLLEDSGARILLTDEKTKQEMHPHANLAHVVTLVVGREDPYQEFPGCRTFPLAQTHRDGLAYVIYTSGTTGVPKGINISHGAFANIFQDMIGAERICENDVLLAVTSPAFDISALELWLPLMVGGRLLMGSKLLSRNGALLVNALSKHQVTLMQATPTTWRIALAADWRPQTGFKAWCGGEAMTTDLAESLIGRGCQLWNFYGPTETTIWSSCCLFYPGENINEADGSSMSSMPIGRPLSNTACYVLNPSMEPVPAGASGQLFIGGSGLGRGYWNQPGLTAEKFVPDPFQSHGAGSRLYQTGDAVRLLPDDELIFLGRLDGQLKLRGFRIEPGEIEYWLLQFPEIAQVAVLAQQNQAGDLQLVAFLVAETKEQPDLDLVKLTRGNQTHFVPSPWSESWRLRLRKNLPETMIPSAFVLAQSLPQLPSGKLDRKSLSRILAESNAPASGEDKPRDWLEFHLCQIWEGVLGLRNIGLNDNFFEIGGHSLSAMQLISQISKEMKRSLSVDLLFAAPTVAQFATALRSGSGPHSIYFGIPSPKPSQRTSDFDPPNWRGYSLLCRSCAVLTCRTSAIWFEIAGF